LDFLNKMKKLIRLATNLLDELGDVIAAIDAELFAHPIALLSNATIGQHTRHIIEFFQCLQQQADSNVINYSLRERNPRIEENKGAALAAIEALTRNLVHLESVSELVLETDEEGIALINTNVERELFYNVEHAIHHMAIIKIGLKVIAPELKLKKSFGVASSTLRKQQP
jgi:hypothetical protein